MDPNVQVAIAFAVGLALAWGVWYIPGMPRMKNKGIAAIVVASIVAAVYKYVIHDWVVKQGWVSDTPGMPWSS